LAVPGLLADALAVACFLGGFAFIASVVLPTPKRHTIEFHQDSAGGVR